MVNRCVAVVYLIGGVIAKLVNTSQFFVEFLLLLSVIFFLMSIIDVLDEIKRK